jgi:hypothetical protein
MEVKSRPNRSVGDIYVWDFTHEQRGDPEIYRRMETEFGVRKIRVEEKSVRKSKMANREIEYALASELQRTCRNWYVVSRGRMTQE